MVNTTISDFGRLDIVLTHNEFANPTESVSTSTERMKELIGKEGYKEQITQLWLDTETFADLTNGKHESVIGTVLEFSNEDLNCELDLNDSVDSKSNNFKFTVWNLYSSLDPAIKVQTDDLIRFKFYWKNNPELFTIYDTIITDVETTQDGGDLKTSFKGSIVEQNLLFRMPAQGDIKKIVYHTDIHKLIENKCGYEYYLDDLIQFDPFQIETDDVAADGSTVIIERNGEFIPEPLSTFKYTVGSLLDKYIELLSETYKTTFHWKIALGNILRVYREEEGLPEASAKFLTIKYEDILSIKDNSDSNTEIKVFGIPSLKSNSAFMIDFGTNPPEISEGKHRIIYLVDEIKSKFTMGDGYTNSIYAHKLPATYVKELLDESQ